MTSLLRTAVAAATIALTLTACGGSSDDSKDEKSSTSKSNAKPATGEKLSTKDFSYTVPDGWKDGSQNVSSVLSLAVDSTDKDGFADNVNVVSENSAADADNVDDLAKAAAKSLESVNAADIKTHDPLDIDGETAAHIGAVFEQNGTKYRTEQYVVGHDDAGFVITFSFSEDVPDAKRDQVSESILATWAWAS